jgi:uncharacterized OB-fold protein
MMKLGICRACGAAQYPPREVCVRCLSDAIDIREGDVAGTVLSLTTIHRSIDPAFSEPTPIASVKIDAGPVAIAFAWAGLKPGARVRLSEEPSRPTGQPRIHARPERG